MGVGHVVISRPRPVGLVARAPGDYHREGSCQDVFAGLAAADSRRADVVRKDAADDPSRPATRIPGDRAKRLAAIAATAEKKNERVMGFEPTTTTLATSCSTN